MARFFDDMNRSNGAVCPICKTDGPGKILLVPIPGTEEGNIMQAQQIHAVCAWLVGREYYDAVGDSDLEITRRAQEAMAEAEAAMEKSQANRDKAEKAKDW